MKVKKPAAGKRNKLCGNAARARWNSFSTSMDYLENLRIPLLPNVLVARDHKPIQQHTRDTSSDHKLQAFILKNFTRLLSAV
jgi:hypothetical protein